MKKLLTVFLCLLIVWLSVAFSGPITNAYAATKAELEQKIDEIDEQISQNRNQLKELESKKDSQQEYLNTLEKQISAVEDKVTALETQISTIDGEIESCNNKIKQLQNEIAIIKEEITAANEAIDKTNAQIDSSKDLLAEKIRAAYINGNVSTIKILMGADSLADFLTSLELMKRMSEEDKKVINEFKQTVAELKKSKATLEEKQTQLDDKNSQQQEQKNKIVAEKKELVQKQNEHSATVKQLENDYAKVEAYIAELDKNSAVYENYIKKLQNEREAADAEIDKLIKEYQATTKPTDRNETLPASNSDPSSGGSSSGGKGGSYASNASWAWPLGGASCYISSGFGYRDASISGWSFHGGTDIAAAYGTPIYASRAGTVISAVWGETGYGRYVVLDHGDGFITLYGHCSSLSVSAGQHVAKGQQIANVGSTGNSRGNHLHFEVRYNGEKQNPMNYVKKP